jgi:hypothetical protein
MTDNVYAPPRANLETREGPAELWHIELKQLKRLYNASHSIRALGVLYGLGAFALVAAVILAIGPSAARESTIVLAVILFVSGGLSVAGAITSFTRPRWGRWLGIVLCVIGLLNIPIGTIIGIFGLIAYAQGGRLFGPDRLMHKDVVDVYKQRKKEKA